MILQRSLLSKYLSRQEQLEVKFREYHAKYPGVYDWFVAFALELIRRGIEQYSAYGIIHEIRYRKKFKISNNLIPYYARKFLRDHPQHGGFFILKELTTENQEPKNE